jgi:protocatechuate 3,4-dioxygenase, beta subunit
VLVEGAFMVKLPILQRRQLLLGVAALASNTSGIAFAALPPTPRQTTGPFYPRTLPLDADNDLVRISGHATNAEGTITHVFGRVLDTNGNAIASAKVEIWQCDKRGHYHHVGDGDARQLDLDFQGYGTTLSATNGSYRFRTIRPVPYPGRTPHIHFAITTTAGRRLITQMYVAGEALNERDPVLSQIHDPASRAAVIVPLVPAPQLDQGALAGTFDIVME